MKKKNLITATVSLALVAIVGVGSTLAYFTDKTETKRNTFTTGSVDIVLNDTSEDPKAEVDPEGTGIVYNEVMPGDLLDKNVSVTVDKASAPAYVGVFVSFNEDIDETAHPNSGDVMGLVSDAMMRAGTIYNWNSYFVTVEDTEGMLYVYNQVVEPNDQDDVVLDLFSDIQIPTTWGNDFAAAHFAINVQAFAAQAENFSEGQFCSMVDGTLTDANGNVIAFEEYGRA